MPKARKKTTFDITFWCSFEVPLLYDKKLPVKEIDGCVHLRYKDTRIFECGERVTEDFGRLPEPVFESEVCRACFQKLLRGVRENLEDACVRIVSGRPYQKGEWNTVWAEARNDKEAVVIFGAMRVGGQLSPIKP